MILTDDMLTVAFQYREAELWEMLTDSDVFAFRLSDGEVGYCCVMGNGDEHLALALYRGQKGFSSYLKTIRLSGLQLSDIGMFEVVLTFDCLNCDFMQASEINGKVKKLIRNFADAHGLKVHRQKGWPDFIRHQPFRMSHGIICEKDANDIVEALRASIAVAKVLTNRSPEEVGFDEEGEYPTVEGGKLVPYLIPNGDGTYNWDSIELPAFLPDEWPAPKFTNDILARSVKKLHTYGTFQVKIIHLPAPIGGEENEAPFLPAILLCLNHEGLLPVFSMEESGENNPEQILVDFAGNLCQSGSKPRTIEVVDDRTELLLTDFCARCDIRLSRKEELPELDDACNFMIGGFMQ